MPPLQQQYYDMLVERIRAERHPSHQMLDRIEATFWTSEQVTGYVALLLEKMEDTQYPSHQLLDRIERMLTIASTVA